MTPLEVLFAVRGLLVKPEAWIQHALIQNGEGKKVDIAHPRASKFSLDGAFHRVQHITHCKCSPAYELLKQTISHSMLIPVSSFNDAKGTTHSLIIETIDKVIRSLGGDPPPLYPDLE